MTVTEGSTINDSNTSEKIVANILLGNDINNTVESAISYTLPDNIKNLTLTGDSYNNYKVINGLNVYGNPTQWGQYLDYYQGDNSDNLLYDCGLVSVENVLIQAGIIDPKIDYFPARNYDPLESQVVNTAQSHNLCIFNGGTYMSDLVQLLEVYGVSAVSYSSKNMEYMAGKIRAGQCVITGVDADVLWGRTNNFSSSTHAVIVTGVAYRSDNSTIAGFYICDSGRLEYSDSSRFISYNLATRAFDEYIVTSGDIVKYILDINGTGNALDNTITGNYGNNTLTGEAGNDTLYGDVGDDKLIGGAGNDYLSGGIGDDTYVFNRGDGQDTIYENSSETSIFEEDTLIFNNISLNDVKFTKSNNNLIAEIIGTTDKITLLNQYTTTNEKVEKFVFEDANLDSEGAIARIETYGTEGANNISDSDFGKEIYGLGGNDTIYGNGGNDTIYGGNGNDSLYGGSEDDYIQGDAGDDTLYGEAGNDTLIGGAGNDYLEGGNGNDTYIFNRGDGQDIIYDSNAYYYSETNKLVFNNISLHDVAFSGLKNMLIIEIVDSTDKITLLNQNSYTGSKIQQFVFADVTLSSAEILNGLIVTATDDIDSMFLEGFSQTVYGLGGNDVIITSGGQNTVYAGAGNDSVYGGRDSDYIQGGAGDDLLRGADGADTISGGDGNDLIFGQDGADTISGGDGNDTICGEYVGDTKADNSADILTGGNGDDVYYINELIDSIIEEQNQGIDTVHSTISYALGDNLENLTLIGTSSINGYGNSLDNTITGNLGKNIMAGGLGNDTYTIDNVGDKVIELMDQGEDTIESVLSYTLAANFENLTLTGTKNINAIGTSRNNTLSGNSGNNLLYGGKGDDVYCYAKGEGQDSIYETAGVDSLRLKNIASAAFVKSGNDLVIKAENSETDKVTIKSFYANANYQLENIYFVDGDNNLVDSIIGTDEILSKVAIQGTANKDKIIGSAFNDNISALDGNDIVYAYAGNDSLEGGSGNDIIDGGEGNDSINGGAGNDTLYGGQGDDVYNYAKGDGQDLIVETSGADSLRLKNIASATFEKSANHLIIKAENSEADTITIKNFYVNANYQLENIYFVDGDGNIVDSIMGKDSIFSKVHISGTANKDKIIGSVFNDNISAGDGNDLIYGYAGNDDLEGGSGSDFIDAGEGNDLIKGADGNDALYGGKGDDTYTFKLGDNQDLICDIGGSADEINFDLSVDKTKIAFFKDKSNNLVIDYGSSVGNDKVTVQSQNTKTIEQVKLADGSYLSSTDINSIINYISAYDKNHVDLTITTVNDVKLNSDLMTYISGQWHS